MIKFIYLIEKHEIKDYDRKNIFKEDKIKFYDGDKLYIYKSNRVRDWTEYMAINDANEEIKEYILTLKQNNSKSEDI